jgi:hypothetical protein
MSALIVEVESEARVHLPAGRLLKGVSPLRLKDTKQHQVSEFSRLSALCSFVSLCP